VVSTEKNLPRDAGKSPLHRARTRVMLSYALTGGAAVLGLSADATHKWWCWHDAYGNEDAKWANVVDNAVATLKV
jgi:hypothetical protein